MMRTCWMVVAAVGLVACGPKKGPETAMKGEPGLALVTAGTDAFNPDAFIAVAMQSGLSLSHPTAEPDGPFMFQLGDALVGIMPVPAPMPDLPQMARSPLTLDDAEIAASRAHFIVTLFGGPTDVRALDTVVAKLAAATMRATDQPTGGMLGHGVMMYKDELFVEAVNGPAMGGLPPLITVDITVAPEPDGKLSCLTHGLDRYGAEDVLIAASNPQVAWEYALNLTGWFLTMEPYTRFPDGDTIGRTPDEKLEIVRVPSPEGPDDPMVIRLDLP